MKKSLLIIICLCFFVGLKPTYADNILETRQQLQKDILLNNEIINANRKEMQELDDSIASIELNLDNVRQKYDNLNVILKDYNNKISTTENNYQKLRNEMLINDYKSSIKNIKSLVFFTKEVMENGNIDIKESSNNISLLQIKEDLLSLKNVQSELLTMQNVQKETVDYINVSYEDLTNKLLQKIQLENFLLNENELSSTQIASIKKRLEHEVRTKSMYSFLSGRGDEYSDTGKSIVKEAKKYLGVPYVWGGVSPKGMDCSGLVLLVMNALDIHPPRVSADQAKFGKNVDLSEVQPGDLLFFDTQFSGNGGVSHVGIYIGNGELLHAPQTGDVVKISKLTRYWQVAFLNAKRYY